MSLFVTLFGESLIVQLTLDMIILTNESSLSRYEYVHISSKYLYVIFLKERKFLSAKADFFSLNILYK